MRRVVFEMMERNSPQIENANDAIYRKSMCLNERTDCILICGLFSFFASAGSASVFEFPVKHLNFCAITCLAGHGAVFRILVDFSRILKENGDENPIHHGHE